MPIAPHIGRSPRRNARLAGAVAGILLAGTAQTASASTPDLSALSQVHRLDDSELSGIRGKFVSPESVSFFGITMLTNWQDESGVITLARLAFNIDFLSSPGHPVPQVMIAWAREGDPAMDVTENHAGYVPYLSPEEVLPIGGLDSFSGAAQANLIAGTDNRALNGLQIAIVPASMLPDLTGGDGTEKLQPIEGTTGLSFPDGDELQFRVADNQIGIAMTGNGGLDSSTQMIGGDIGKILQQTVLNSDFNNITNTASVIFGIDTLQNMDTVRAQESLSVMKGQGL